MAANALNSSTLSCTTPEWDVKSDKDILNLAMAENEALSLIVTSGDCSLQETFQYYSDPQIVGVSPLQGPRYGSFAFTVSLGYSLSSLGADGMVSLLAKSKCLHIWHVIVYTLQLVLVGQFASRTN